MSDTEPAHPLDDTSGAPPAAVPRRGRRWATFAALFLVAVIGGAGLFTSGFALGRLAGSTPGTSADQQDLFRPFWDAYNDVASHYVGTVDQHALVEGAIKGIFEALGDPFSFYMTEAEYQASLSGLSGEFEGVGINLATQDAQGQSCDTISATCRLTITGVIRGAPAVTAGLQAGDVITAIDGQSIDGSTANDVVGLIRGPRGTTVTLTIDRDGTSQDIVVKRDVVQREDVTSQVLANGKVGYVKVAGFSSGSADDLQNQLQALVDDHVTGLVLDLRDDPGGYVDAAQKIASEFVSVSPLYWEQTAGQPPMPIQPIPGGVAIDPALHVAVLVNGGTASASEIVAGSLQGNGRAVLVGQQTYGKGTIQEFKQLPGSGGYRLSVRKWLTPDQTWINGIGLTPDIPVDPAAQGQAGDPQLERAIQYVLGQPTAAPSSATPSAVPATSSWVLQAVA